MLGSTNPNAGVGPTPRLLRTAGVGFPADAAVAGLRRVFREPYGVLHTVSPQTPLRRIAYWPFKLRTQILRAPQAPSPCSRNFASPAPQGALHAQRAPP